MRVHYIAEYDEGARIACTRDLVLDVSDEAEAYRCAARLLAQRPHAHRVEVWSGSVYVTRATRGVEVAPTQADLFAAAQDDRDDPRSER